MQAELVDTALSTSAVRVPISISADEVDVSTHEPVTISEGILMLDDEVATTLNFGTERPLFNFTVAELVAVILSNEAVLI